MLCSRRRAPADHATLPRRLTSDERPLEAARVLTADAGLPCMKVSFVSRNERKAREAIELMAPRGIEVRPVIQVVTELQTVDLRALVEDKCLKAFASVGRPVFVEHTALYLDALNSLPGGLTQIFWDCLEVERFADLFVSEPAKARAVSAVGYCDGKRIHTFTGALRGTVVGTPAGPRDFHWDCIFVPEGRSETLAQLGIEKNQLSMRRKALDELADHLSRVPRP